VHRWLGPSVRCSVAGPEDSPPEGVAVNQTTEPLEAYPQVLRFHHRGENRLSL